MPAKINPIDGQFQCLYCNKIKDLKFFTKNKNSANGYIRTCLECNSERTKKQHHLQRGESPIKHRCKRFLLGIKYRSKNKNMEFDKTITIEKLMEMLINTKKCPCCGVELEIEYVSKNTRENNYPSIDRIDSSKGYIEKNIAIICWRCNYLKNDGTAAEHKLISEYMEKFINEQI